MTHAHRAASQAPALVRFPGPIMRRLLGSGLPLGPNGLLAIRGRRTGLVHEVPLAVLEFQGRRWVVGAYGDVNWCRNLRAEPHAVLRLGGRTYVVRARELDRDEATQFYGNVSSVYVPSMPLRWRLVVRVLIGTAAPEIFSDPEMAAVRHPVFELITEEPGH